MKKENKTFNQLAKVRDRENIPYLISCKSNQSEDQILKSASNFYETEMIAIERRTEIGKALNS